MKFIDSLINDRITSVYRPTQDMYGDQSLTVVATNILCKFNDSPEYVYSSKGVVELGKATAWMKSSETAVNEGDKVVYNGNEYEVIVVEDKYGLRGEIQYKRLVLR